MANNFTKTMRQALQEARDYRDVQEGFSTAQIKMAYGVLNDPRYKQGNYDGAVKAIEKIAKGLSDHPDVKNALKRANEELLDLPATGDTTTSNASQEVETVEEESTDEMFSTRSLGLKGASKRSRDKAREKDKDSEKSKKKEDLDEARFSQSQIDQLKKAYTPLSAKATDMHVSKLKNKMKSYSISHLSQLSTSGIPMVSDAAKELLARDKRFAEEVAEGGPPVDGGPGSGGHNKSGSGSKKGNVKKPKKSGLDPLKIPGASKHMPADKSKKVSMAKTPAKFGGDYYDQEDREELAYFQKVNTNKQPAWKLKKYGVTADGELVKGWKPDDQLKG